jgi:hypothetical protein
VYTVILRVPQKGGEFFEYASDFQLLKKDSVL